MIRVVSSVYNLVQECRLVPVCKYEEILNFPRRIASEHPKISKTDNSSYDDIWSQPYKIVTPINLKFCIGILNRVD